MDYIALRNIGPCTSLRLMPPDKINELLAKAKSGDTLHKVPDEVRLDINLLMEHISQQLTRNEYVRVP